MDTFMTGFQMDIFPADFPMDMLLLDWQRAKFMADFLKFDYVEMKDLSKAFLTLAAAILAFSITFSEKIIGFQSAIRASRVMLLVSWCFFITSVILCGIALCLIFASGAKATHGNGYFAGLKHHDWFLDATIAGWALFAAGGSFAIGLVSLIASAAASIFWGTANQAPIPAGPANLPSQPPAEPPQGKHRRS